MKKSNNAEKILYLCNALLGAAAAFLSIVKFFLG